MTAQFDLFGTPVAPSGSRHTRPVLRRIDLEGATSIRTSYGTYDVVRVNSDDTLTIRDQGNPQSVPHVVPYSHVEGISR